MKPVTIYQHDEAITLVLPDHLADWGVWDYWEHERYRSIVTELAEGVGTLWEIGAEHGAQAALYAEALGGDRLVLVEPSPEMWRNIRMTWEANQFELPAGTIVALVGDTWVEATDLDHDPAVHTWPACALESDEECPAMAYRYLHNPKDPIVTRTVTLDDMAQVHPAPAGISIDVEGAELKVLHGGQQLLLEERPLVWVSVHPDLIERDYAATAADVHEFMEASGYAGELLATDHEEHWLYRPDGYRADDAG